MYNPVFDRFRYGIRQNIEIRRELREKATSAERTLWDCIKSKKLQGLKFRRQHGIGRWVVDFFHGASRTVIELDGTIHNDPEVREHDRVRQEYLESIGCTVLRFKNEVVFYHLEIVIQKILEHIQQKIKKSLSSPAVRGEGCHALRGGERSSV